MEEKSIYNSLAEWKKSDINAYSAAKHRGWIDSICKTFGWKQSNRWTKEKCKEEALKYNSKRQWELNSIESFQACYRNKWQEECCAHMINIKKANGYWKLEKCKEEALKYQTKKEWMKKGRGSYAACVANGWIKQCDEHMH